jgi:hypothetical protein
LGRRSTRMDADAAQPVAIGDPVFVCPAGEFDSVRIAR